MEQNTYTDEEAFLLNLRFSKKELKQILKSIKQKKKQKGVYKLEAQDIPKRRDNKPDWVIRGEMK